MGRKYRLYPTTAHEKVLTEWGHSARALWNLALEQRQYVYRQRRVTLRSVEQCLHLTAARSEIDWLADLPATAGQQVLRHLDLAYDNFFNPSHPAGHPQFKKRGHRLKISFPGQKVKVRKLNRHWAEVCIPKMGWVRFRLSRALGGVVRNATISKDGVGWHVSFGVATGARPLPPIDRPGCGVDFGVAASAYVSTENEPRRMPTTLSAAERTRLRHLEQKKARQISYAKKYQGGRYSERLRETIQQIAKIRVKQACRRRDFTHKLTTELAKNHGYVGIEDLRVMNMTRSARGSAANPGSGVRAKAALNRVILDNCPGERRRQLEYKCRLYGSELRPVPAFHTSNTCGNPACGKVDPGSRQGCGRLFSCVHCGFEDDADHNAAVEIDARARQGVPPARARRTGGSVNNSTRRRVTASSPGESRRRMREAQTTASG
ncbi:RNA-guided endonuclease InsQ/TnpB family protein [Streptomyces sp. NBC_01236]|uniref:RNA-guided endonuclease InsQ/TnpB family protein n=1 Tax=Streptomyces sp. NBC_01236 TaxID=2903789 RepID=UPI002E142474|nr:transposase [Streptomyces sp. NBC_01236]